jgi:hypothetical protein
LIALVIGGLVLVVMLVTVVFLLGFRLGGDPTERELLRVRMHAQHARRQLSDITRQAFVALTDELEGRREK